MDPDSKPRPRTTGPRKTGPQKTRNARTTGPRKTRKTGTRKARIRIVITDARGLPARAAGLGLWLSRIAPGTAPRQVTIALVSDARIRQLNRQFRKKDQATDVLSFEPSDVAIATGVARRQARELGHSYADELKVLALHGLLHLMGYDHHARADGGRMARLERRLRAKGGLRAGLIERAQPSRR